MPFSFTRWLKKLNPNSRRMRQPERQVQVRKTRSLRLLVESLEDRILPALPLSGVAAPFTQELIATAAGNQISGFAFDAQDNPYYYDFVTHDVYKVDLSSTITSHGSTIHPVIDNGVCTWA